MTIIPRPEHPRPQFVRDAWLNLNGEWQFALDPGRSGRSQGFPTAGSFPETILVPFCPESELSGIRHKDFMPAVWYRRTVTLPESWQQQRVLLHFGAVDYDAEVWVNGQTVGTHRGGYASFTLEITGSLHPGENVITVCAEDDVRTGLQPGGKQSPRYESYACMYTRTTGIWQTVWLEAVPQNYLAKVRMTPDLENGRLYLQAQVEGAGEGLTLTAHATLSGSPVGQDSARVSGNLAQLVLTIDPAQIHPWAPDSPTLYDLQLELRAGEQVIDMVTSYFGLRSLDWRGTVIRLNGKPLFQRLVLDQGFYPDGIYTAPSDDALRGDIERGLAMGFNGARLHEKVFEERFLYWADRLGYLVWGEMGNWGLDHARPEALERFLPEWREVLERDFNHPGLVGWCPFNETPGNQDPELLRQVFRTTKSLDPTRPVIDTSGYVHVETDIFDAHDYDQHPETFKQRWDALALEAAPHESHKLNAPYLGQPYLMSEYGGIWWNPGQQDEKSWGYGNRPKSETEFLARYRGLTEALLDNPRLCGFCYTQLTDVEQEVNGLYTYHRQLKFDPALIREINTQPAAIEQKASNR
ncbi:MAG TPA: glycoside hydrolase family 2 TIM barrel-domain containing protein [Armatimonadota bacterium]